MGIAIATAKVGTCLVHLRNHKEPVCWHRMRWDRWRGQRGTGRENRSWRPCKPLEPSESLTRASMICCRWCETPLATMARGDYGEQDGCIECDWNSAYRRSRPLICPLWGKETCKQIIKTWLSNGTNTSHWFWLSNNNNCHLSVSDYLPRVRHSFYDLLLQRTYKARGVIHRSPVCKCHPISWHPQLSTA